MKNVVRKVSLDVVRKTNTRFNFASQADFGTREFLITLLEDGVFYPVDKSVTATVNVLRPDGRSTAYIVEVTDDGRIRYTAGLWALRQYGETKFSVSLYDGDKKRLTSSYFVINVEEGLHLGTDMLEGDTDHTTFMDMMTDFASLRVAERERGIAESQRRENEIMRAEFEQLRRTDEYERQVNEEARISAEAIRQKNEATRLESDAKRVQMSQTLTTALRNILYLQQIYIDRAWGGQ